MYIVPMILPHGLDHRVHVHQSNGQNQCVRGFVFRWRWFILSTAIQRPEGPPLSRGMASEAQSRRCHQRKCEQVSRGGDLSVYIVKTSVQIKKKKMSWIENLKTQSYQLLQRESSYNRVTKKCVQSRINNRFFIFSGPKLKRRRNITWIPWRSSIAWTSWWLRTASSSPTGGTSSGVLLT